MKPLISLQDYLEALDDERIDAEEQAMALLRRAKEEPEAKNVFLHLNENAPQEAYHAAQQGGRLSGVLISVKDLFDQAGLPTQSGSKAYPATLALKDATVVSRLKAEGAVIAGRTNMTEFAFSGIGINPHFGTPRNAIDPTRIPGGSSAGAGVAVALGLGWAALGSDTGGSVRVPAALNGVVGFKPTARRVPLAGVLPLSSQLDSVGPITRCVADAIELDDILTDAPMQIEERTVKGMRFVVAENLMQDGLDKAVSEAFDAALRRLSKAGAVIEMAYFKPLDEISSLYTGGGFAPYEARQFFAPHLPAIAAQLDPRVLKRIEQGAGLDAQGFAQLQQVRAAWITRMETLLSRYDAWLAPTVPVVAPLLKPLLNDDDLFFKTNSLMMRNTAPINMLDGCALTLPIHKSGLAVGLQIAHSAMKDARVLSAARAIERAL